MNKNAAPITQKAWDEIHDTARQSLKNFLSARYALHVDGPHKLGYNVVNTGRLGELQEREDVCFANYIVKPLTEIRIEFDLKRFELDNIERGVEDCELDNLEEACEKIAKFEENAVYNGLKEAGIKGLFEYKNDKYEFGKEAFEIRKNVALAVNTLKKNYAERPFDLVVSEEILQRIYAAESPYSLYEAIEKIIGGKILTSTVIEGAILLAHDDEDLKLVIGQDFTVGFQDFDNETVTLYIQESFTTRVLDEDKFIVFKK